MEQKPSPRIDGRKRHHEDDTGDATSLPRKRVRTKITPGSIADKKKKKKSKTKKKKVVQIKRAKPSLLTLPREVRQQIFFDTFENAITEDSYFNLRLTALKIILIATGPPVMPHVAAWAADLSSVHPVIHLDLHYVLNAIFKDVEILLEELLGTFDKGGYSTHMKRWKMMMHDHGLGRLGIEYDAGRTAMKMIIKYALNSHTAQLVLDSTCLKRTRVQNARSFLTRRGFGA